MIGEFCYKNVYEEKSKQSKGCKRVDIGTDLYPNGTFIGMNVEFDNTPFPIDNANNFLRRSENKCKFYLYLVELILQKYQVHDKIVVATKMKELCFTIGY